MNIHVKREIAPKWYDLGLQLLQGEHRHELNIIKTNNIQNVEVCCREMFEYWLRVDETASWDKLISALQAIGQNTLAANIKQNILKGNIIFIVTIQLLCLLFEIIIIIM